MLYLLPNLLGLCPPERVLPAETIALTRTLRHFVVETPKAARAFLGTLGMPVPLRELNLMPIAEQPFAEVKKLWLGHAAVGLLSDAGCPGVADPGAALVSLAHHNNIKVVPLVGPSSILLGLMASGMNGQHFTFHGYLPQDKHLLSQRLRELSDKIRQQGSTELFIETPYRHASLLQTLLTQVDPELCLCIAQGLTTEAEKIRSAPIKNWQTHHVEKFLNKTPSLFLLGKTPSKQS
ncbi:MAG: hypothetical protein RLZZ502_1353 [Pseudomonadota bacterium]|jgi:16S rRNA (cytidine1402-2'-O)-methyltransferase